MDQTWDLGVVMAQLCGSTCWVRFNRPEALNALNPDVVAALDNAFSICESNDAIRVVVLAGDSRAFMSGSDVRRAVNYSVSEVHVATDEVMRMHARLYNLAKPTIAAISGYALGAGLEIALYCDFRIAADNSSMGLPEIKLGIIPGGGGTQVLPRMVGLAVATKLVVLGEMITAEEAKTVGLVNEVVPFDRLEYEVEVLSNKLSTYSPAAISAAKSALRSSVNASLSDGLNIEQGLFCSLFGTKDQREGMSAFIERRKPFFTGQ